MPFVINLSGNDIKTTLGQICSVQKDIGIYVIIQDQITICW